MFKNLRNRLLLINLVVISIIMLTSFTAIYIIINANLTSENMERLNRIPIANTNFIKNLEDIENPKIKKQISEVDTSFNIFLDKDGNVTRVSSYIDLVEEEYISIAEQVFNSSEELGTIIIDDREWLYRKSSIGHIMSDFEIETENKTYYEISFLDITNTQETMQTLLIALVSVGIAVLIIIYIISIYFANRSIKPLEEVWNKQKQFVADATHELKTPLTIINANIDAIEVNKNAKVKEQEKWLKHIKAETKGMNKLINELLMSAKNEEEKYKLVNINLGQTLKEIITSVEAIVFEKDIKLKVDIAEEITVNTEPEKLRQVIIILIDNAIKYTNNSGEINVSLRKSKKQIELSITNTGEGISKEDLPHIFDRFYKCDKSRTENNSYGLGLFIAKTIVTKLGGKITAISIPKEITEFIIKL